MLSQDCRKSTLLARLRHDILELESAPYPGVELHAHDASYKTVCLILTPQSGPFCGLRLHFEMQLPSNWPGLPPKIISSHGNGLNHPNIFCSLICCDLLMNNNTHRCGNYTGGYTPAFTLKALAIQMLSFFTATSVEQNYGGQVDLGDEFIVKDIKDLASEVELERSIGLAFASRSGGLAFASRSGGLAFASRSGGLLDDDSTREHDAGRESNMASKSRCFRTYCSEVFPPKSKILSISEIWDGWKVGNVAPREVELTRFTDIGNGAMIRLRLRNPRWTNAYNTIRKFECPKCKHNTDGKSFFDISLMKTLTEATAKMDGVHPDDSAVNSEMVDAYLPTTAHEAHYNQPPKECQLQRLHNDVLLIIADQLPDESIYSFSNAWQRFKYIVRTAHVMKIRELQCFYLKKPLNSPSTYKEFTKTILGTGVHYSYDGTISSNFDFLSLEAYELHKVRAAVNLSHINYFLPLAFSQAHFERAELEIWDRLRMLRLYDLSKEREWAARRTQGRVRSAYIHGNLPEASPNSIDIDSVNVLYKIMNNVIVSLMKSADDIIGQGQSWSLFSTSDDAELLKASEKSVAAYCQLFHLLISLAQLRPLVRMKAYEDIMRFKSFEANRIKDHVPDLGVLIVKICIVNATASANHVDDAFHQSFSWPHELCVPFLAETFTRNVRWILKDHPELEIEEEGDSLYRRNTTFKASRTSLRLVMFQTYFLRFFVTNIVKNPQCLNDNYGYPPDGVVEAIVKEIKAIYAVASWKEYFQKVEYRNGMRWTNEKLTAVLRESLRVARSRGSAYYERPRVSNDSLQYTRKICDSCYMPHK